MFHKGKSVSLLACGNSFVLGVLTPDAESEGGQHGPEYKLQIISTTFIEHATSTYAMVDLRRSINRIAPDERLVQHLNDGRNDRLILSKARFSKQLQPGAKGQLTPSRRHYPSWVVCTVNTFRIPIIKEAGQDLGTSSIAIWEEAIQRTPCSRP